MSGPDPDQLVPLTSARTEFEAAAKAEVLKSHGIPAHVFAAAANTLQAEVLFTDPIKLMVRRADLARAAALLRDVRQASVDIDWADVDVGSPEPGSVPPGPGIGPRVGGWSPRMAALRKAGWVLLFAALVIQVVEPRQGFSLLAALLIASLLAAGSWRAQNRGPRRMGR